MPWNPATDPFYRAILVEIADTEWQIVEKEFSEALLRGETLHTTRPEAWARSMK